MASTPSIGSRSNSQSASPASVLAVLPFDSEDTQNATRPAWRTILSDSHQVVLYNSDSHALSVRPNDTKATSEALGSCPYCNRPLEGAAGGPPFREEEEDQRTFASNYFHLLEIANETSSRPSSRRGSRLGSVEEDETGTRNANDGEHGFRADAMAEGYFNAFFKEEYRLGMGANGSVFLCQHVLDGNPLGHFAVKKIAVGQSHSYLLQILREVRLLEQLRHPNIVTYHHAWLESHQFSSFGLKIPTLFVLMQWAEGGSLDDYIDARLGRPYASGGHPPSLDEAFRSKSDRIRAFRAARAQTQEERERRKAERLRGVRTAVHLLSAEEAKSLFADITSGLSFLHDKSILHLDLKPGNVLLTWDDGALIPRAMLSDFGTSRDMIRPSSSRSGNTGTLEYAAPETLRSPETGRLSQLDSKADMWSLGMILHMLLFFRLPYHYSSSGDMKSGDGGNIQKLEEEVFHYDGFRRTPAFMNAFEMRGLPAAYLILLESLLHRSPKKRPSCEQVLRAIVDGNFDPQPSLSVGGIGEGTLVPRMSPPAYIGAETGFEGNGFAELENEVLDDGQRPSELELETPRVQAEKGDELESDLDDESSPMLALPPAVRPYPLDSFARRQLRPVFLFWMSSTRWIGLSRSGVIRGVKSIVLAIKVLTLFSACPEGQPKPIFLCFIVVLAISDTWSESLWLTPILGFVHVFILRFHCSNFSCCNSTLIY